MPRTLPSGTPAQAHVVLPPARHILQTAGLPLLLAVLALLHPTWAGVSIAEGVAASRGLWLPLHVALLAGYLALAWLLWCSTTAGWPLARASRAVLASFAALNTAFLLLDGVAVGLLATADPLAADNLWASPGVRLLANATGAAWSASLLLLAVVWSTPAAGSPPRNLVVGAGATWLAFVAAALPGGLPTLVSRLAATATAALLVYARGAQAIPPALLIVSAVLRQHVGPEAALGLVFLAAALSIRSLKPQ